MLLFHSISIIFLNFSLITFGESQLQNRIFQQKKNVVNVESEAIPYLRRSGRSVIEDVIPQGYNLNDLPPNEIPVSVGYSAVIMAIEDIHEIEEEISIEMILRLTWTDKRLAQFVDSIQNSSTEEYLLLKQSLLSYIWTPDVFIDHLKKLEQPGVLQTPMSLRMYANSTLRFSARMIITVSCKMHFHAYPKDVQKCNIDLKSYGYTREKFILYWRDHFGAEFANSTPLEVQNFFVELGKTNKFEQKTRSGRKYSVLRFTLILKRKLSYHLLQTFLPSVILVVVSWLSFLISLESVPARTGLLMTCLLTLISMFASVRQSTPNVSYVKAIDIWMFVCVFFVFLALLEFTIALKIKMNKGNPKRYKSKPNGRRMLVSIEENEMEILNNQSISKLIKDKSNINISDLKEEMNTDNNLTRKEELIERLELVSSIGIPLLFICFNFIYWPCLILIRGGNANDKIDDCSMN